MIDLKILLTKILTAIKGKVSKTGDTMSGNLTINQAYAIIRSAFTRGTAPASNSASNGYIIYDTGSSSLGRFDAYFYSDDREGVRVGTSRTPTGGSALGNYIILTIDPSGNRHVSVTDAAAWRTALGLSHYDDTSVSTSTISSIIAVNSTNATISSASYVQHGNVAMINIVWTNKSAITVPANGNSADVAVGTIVSGKRPALAWSLTCGTGNENQQNYSVSTAGAITLVSCEATGASRTIAAGTQFVFRGTYIVA